MSSKKPRSTKPKRFRDERIVNDPAPTHCEHCGCKFGNGPRPANADPHDGCVCHSAWRIIFTHGLSDFEMEAERVVGVASVLEQR